MTPGIGAVWSALQPPASEVEHYKQVTHPAWLLDIRRELDLLAERLNQNPPPAMVNCIVRNVGHAPAEEIRVGFRASPGLMVSRPLKTAQGSLAGENDIVLPKLPAPPRSFLSTLAESSSPGASQFSRFFVSASRAPREAGRFYSSVESSLSSPAALTFDCELFRHRSDDARFEIGLASNVDSEVVGGLLTCQVSATNLRVPIEVTVPVIVEKVNRSAYDIATSLIEQAISGP
jgi:hypothetical protein